MYTDKLNMNLKILIYFMLFVILLHFICFFFDIDILECFEKKQSLMLNETNDEDFDSSIDSLSKSLEQLKEITQT